MAARSILLMNGPNLDMLGIREPGVYGTDTLRDVEERVATYAASRGVSVSCFQSNSEGELVNTLHAANGRFDGIVYNPGAHTHYSYALRDAIAAISTPVVEVHISDVDAREPFRRISVIAPVCVAQVKGLGVEGYCRAIDVLCDYDHLEKLGEAYAEQSFEGVAIGAPASASNVEAPREESQIESSASREEGPLADEAILADDAMASEFVSASVDQAADEDFAEPYAEDAYAVGPAVLSAERLRRIRETCERAGVDALMVRDTPNVRWACAVDGVFDEERAHALAITRDRAVLHTDSRYSNALRTAIARGGAPVEVNDDRVSHAAFTHDILSPEGLAFEGRMGIEDTIAYREFAALTQQFEPRLLAATSDLVLGLRAVKDRVELSRLLAAQAVTDAAFVHIVRFMRPGMTEREVQLELEDYMVRHGAEELAFSSIVATGANGADPHAIPGDARLEAGQCVVMDFGAKAFGYCSDMTRVVFLGHPDERMAHAWEVLRQANETVEALLRPGVTGREAHETAERVLAEGGFEGKMGHGLGHGVGLEIHEQPVLNSRNEAPLVAGNVVTVEPGIYLPGEFGMRLEDCGIVTDGGYEVFSQLGHDMIVI